MTSHVQHPAETIGARIDAMLRADPLPGSLVPDYLRQAMLAYPQSGGKRLRPALLIGCCEAAGGDSELAWDAALSVELYHNWTLIHDDIIDDDGTRRGRPTCHRLLAGAGERLPGGAERRRRVFGANMAILAGDALHGWSVACLARTVRRGASADVVLALVERMCSWLTPALIGGEALDVEFELQPDVDGARIRSMMFLKTGALLQFCAEAGVMIGGGLADVAHPRVAAAGRFAALAGVAFQIQDDLLGVFGDAEKLGKPVGSDIAEGKRTLLIAQTFALASEKQRQTLYAIMGCGDEASGSHLQTCREIIESCGARQALTDEAEGLANEARQRLADAFPPSPARDNLENWLDFLVKRSH